MKVPSKFVLYYNNLLQQLESNGLKEELDFLKPFDGNQLSSKDDADKFSLALTFADKNLLVRLNKLLNEKRTLEISIISDAKNINSNLEEKYPNICDQLLDLTNTITTLTAVSTMLYQLGVIATSYYIFFSMAQPMESKKRIDPNMN